MVAREACADHPEPVPAGTRVEIAHRLLEPGQRAPGLPPDTAAVPYEVRVRGILIEDGRRGERARVRTAAGRVLSGRLETVEPGDWHSFGRPPQALTTAIAAIEELRGELGMSSTVPRGRPRRRADER